MHKAQQQVEEFHRALDMTVGEAPEIRDGELRAALILEEAIETAEALVGRKRLCELTATLLGIDNTDTEPDTVPDFVEAIDGLCDVLVVTYGTAVACGVDLEPFYNEVHRSNMAKVGGPVRADGKRLKPEGWQPPRIKEMLDDLRARR